MAKRTKTRARRRPAAIAVRRPSNTKAAVKAATTKVRASAKKAAAKSQQSSMTMALAATAGLAVMDRKGVELPYVGTVGNAAAVGLALYALPMVLPSSVVSEKTKKTMAQASTGPLSIALYEYVSESEHLDFLD